MLSRISPSSLSISGTSLFRGWPSYKRQPSPYAEMDHLSLTSYQLGILLRFVREVDVYHSGGGHNDEPSMNHAGGQTELAQASKRPVAEGWI